MKQFTGIFIILASTLVYALLTPLFKKANLKIQPFTVIAISMFFLFISSLILSFIFEKGLSFKLGNNKNEVLILVAAGLLNTFGFWLAILAFKYMPIWQQTMFTLLVPPLAGIIAYFLLGEALTTRLFIGLAIMGVGLFVAVR